MEPITFVLAVFAAMIYALLGYLKSVDPEGTPEEMDWPKIAATMVLGVLIGFGLAVMDIPVTAETVAVQMLSYTGVLYLVEAIIKAVIRRWQAWKAKSNT